MAFEFSPSRLHVSGERHTPAQNARHRLDLYTRARRHKDTGQGEKPPGIRLPRQNHRPVDLRQDTACRALRGAGQAFGWPHEWNSPDPARRPRRAKSLHRFCTNPGQTFRLHNFCTSQRRCTDFAQIFLPEVAQRITITLDSTGFCLLICGQ